MSRTFLLTTRLFFDILHSKEVKKLKDRIKKIRKEANLTQEKFAERLGLKRNTIATYETGKSEPMDNIIVSICREFGINENWLRTGEGNMKKPLTRNQEIFNFANDVMELNDEKFKKRFVEALARLDERDWEALETIIDKLTKEG